MRIRSIRPEFWRSEDITGLERDDRLLFIGLWSYVDDNGVGLDRLADITADLFAGDVERDPPETFARVSRGLANLSERLLITRYDVDGKAYLHITNWLRHQRIDKPGKQRYPLPTSENAVIRESLARVSRNFQEPSTPGEGEKGRRGEGDISTPLSNEQSPARAKRERGGRAIAEELNRTAHSPEAHSIAREYERRAGKVPGDVLSKIAQSVDGCLQSGYTTDQIHSGLDAWSASDMVSPSQIANFVLKSANRATGIRDQPSGPVVGKPGSRAIGWADAARELAAQQQSALEAQNHQGELT